MTTGVNLKFGRCLRPALAPLRGSARFAIFGLAAIAIAGCDSAQVEREKVEVAAEETRLTVELGVIGFGEAVHTFTDPATGCQYLIYNGMREGGITPRLMPDGSPMCIPAPPEGFKVEQ